MKVPRIVHVIHSSAFGGGPNMLAVICTELHHEFEMELVCDGQGDVPARLEQLGVTVHRMPLTTKWSFAAHMPELAGLVRARKPDLVHLHGQFAGSLGQLAIQLAGRPKTVYSVQWPSFLDDAGRWSRLRNRVAELVSCGGAAAVVAVSETDRREFIRRRLCDASKITVIHNSYTNDEAPPTARSDGQPIVGFVGRLVDQKGCETLIRAIPDVRRAHPSARFVLVGDGPLKGALEALSRTLGVTESVDFVGYQAEPSAYMARMDVVVIPSIYDPFPLVTVEAMELGRPVVASAVGGIPEAVVDGRTGFLVPPRNPKALATAVSRILDDPALAARLGEAARARAISEFSPEVSAAKYADLYRRLL